MTDLNRFRCGRVFYFRTAAPLRHNSFFLWVGKHSNKKWARPGCSGARPHIYPPSTSFCELIQASHFVFVSKWPHPYPTAGAPDDFRVPAPHPPAPHPPGPANTHWLELQGYYIRVGIVRSKIIVWHVCESVSYCRMGCPDGGFFFAPCPFLWICVCVSQGSENTDVGHLYVTWYDSVVLHHMEPYDAMILDDPHYTHIFIQIYTERERELLMYAFRGESTTWEITEQLD